ncbi:MAG: CHAD domain-containing protein [Ignavibacteria bacterium]|jgi:CHAD domain-containing protein|nr:CHAD domain-containing protein [Ignavibacteria bacterium]MCU7514284.1 CHAD domain-containing protein [Ignavibacteria bacterium]
MTKSKGLRRDTPFSVSASIILSRKYNDARKKTERFLDEATVKNLHSLRIAIRRLRYSLENFEVCFSRKLFEKNIEYLKSLQDLIGIGRDLDMLKENLDILEPECGIKIPEEINECIDAKKGKNLQEIKLEFLKFLHNKDARHFFTAK